MSFTLQSKQTSIIIRLKLLLCADQMPREKVVRALQYTKTYKNEVFLNNTSFRKKSRRSKIYGHINVMCHFLREKYTKLVYLSNFRNPVLFSMFVFFFLQRHKGTRQKRNYKMGTLKRRNLTKKEFSIKELIKKGFSQIRN